MRRLVMWNLMTLDGCFEGAKSWDLDWHETVWDDELERFSIEQSKAIGMLLFGRLTYEGMAAYWSSATGAIADFMNSVPKVVFSTTLKHAAWDNTRLVSSSAEDEVAKLKQDTGKDLYVFGSGKLCRALMRSRLIDEYRLCVTPIVLGRGNPLFAPRDERTLMKLLEATPLRSGCVILRYRPATPPA